MKHILLSCLLLLALCATALAAPVGRTGGEGTPWHVPQGSEVTEDQMLSLFGLGRHPNAEQIETAVMAGPTGSPASAEAAGRSPTSGSYRGSPLR